MQVFLKLEYEKSFCRVELGGGVYGGLLGVIYSYLAGLLADRWSRNVHGMCM